MMKTKSKFEDVLPGYTGHIPSPSTGGGECYKKERPRNEIPGYAGYVKSIKSENIHASTYGRSTYNVSCENYLQGQDVPPQFKYKSTTKDAYINPKDMIRTTPISLLGRINPPEVKEFQSPKK
jgi:hypothetical protein